MNKKISYVTLVLLILLLMSDSVKSIIFGSSPFEDDYTFNTTYNTHYLNDQITNQDNISTQNDTYDLHLTSDTITHEDNITCADISGLSADLCDGSDADTTYSHLSNFTDDLSDRGYTHLSNFTDNIGVSSDYDSLSDFTGSLTDTKICTYDSSLGIINCTYTDINTANTTNEIFSVCDNETWVRKSNTTLNTVLSNDPSDYDSLGDLQTAVSNDFHNLGGTDINTANTTNEIQAVAVGGEVSGTVGSITLDNDALDDQYYDSESDLTTLLDDNYLGTSGDTGNGEYIFIDTTYPVTFGYTATKNGTLYCTSAGHCYIQAMYNGGDLFLKASDSVFIATDGSATTFEITDDGSESTLSASANDMVFKWTRANSATQSVEFKGTNSEGTVNYAVLSGHDGATNQNGVFNVNPDGSAYVDFIVESDSSTYMFFVDGGNNRAGINDQTPDSVFDIQGTGTEQILRVTGSSSDDRINLIQPTCVWDDSSGSNMASISLAPLVSPQDNISKLVWGQLNNFILTNSIYNITGNTAGVLYQLQGQASYDGSLTNYVDLQVGSGTMAGGGSVLSKTALKIGSQTLGTETNIAIETSGGGDVIINEGGTSSADVRIESDTDQYNFFSNSSSDSICIGCSYTEGNKTKIDGDMIITGDLFLGGTQKSYSPVMFDEDICMKDHTTDEWVRCGSYNYVFSCLPDEYCEKKNTVLEDKRANPEKYIECHTEKIVEEFDNCTTNTVCQTYTGTKEECDEYGICDVIEYEFDDCYDNIDCGQPIRSITYNTYCEQIDIYERGIDYWYNNVTAVVK